MTLLERVATLPGAGLGAAYTNQSPAKPAPKMPRDLTPSDGYLLNLMRLEREYDEPRGCWLPLERPKRGREAIETAVATALIANVDAGVLSLVAAQRESFFGLFKSDALGVRPGRHGRGWPEGSGIELALCGHMARADTVCDVVYNWLQESSGDPWTKALDSTLERMSRRGLLESREARCRFLVFSWTRKQYLLPDGLSERAIDMAAERAHRLLADDQQRRPQHHAVLLEQIQSAFVRRDNSG